MNNIIIRILLLSCFCFATESFAQKRLALVIGNSDYQKQSLRNPINDARDISKTLRSLGFSVDLKLNANQNSMERAIQKFGKSLHDNSVGLFYYSGHGVQNEDSNYLVPIGTISRISTPKHLRYKAIDVGYVLGVMKQAGNGFNILILDACRDNPFKSFSRSMTKGLKKISNADGVIIAYSTSPGKVALDGNGNNSPYTENLIQLMQKPNLPIELMFKQVRKNVKLTTHGKQSPWYESSIDGEFYFKIDSTISQQNNFASMESKYDNKHNNLLFNKKNVSKIDGIWNFESQKKEKILISKLENDIYLWVASGWGNGRKPQFALFSEQWGNYSFFKSSSCFEGNGGNSGESCTHIVIDKNNSKMLVYNNSMAVGSADKISNYSSIEKINNISGKWVTAFCKNVETVVIDSFSDNSWIWKSTGWGDRPKKQRALLSVVNNKYVFQKGSLCIEGVSGGMLCSEILLSENKNYIVILNKTKIIAILKRSGDSNINSRK